MLKSEYPLAIADYLGIPPFEGVAGPWMSTTRDGSEGVAAGRG